MDPRLWHKVAAVSGVAAMGFGTYGSHVFKPKDPTYKEVWQKASVYHFLHTAALVAAPVTKHPNIFGGLLTTGIVAFSGTPSKIRSDGRGVHSKPPPWSPGCYTVALLEDKKYATLAPFGGFAFIGAWASLLF